MAQDKKQNQFDPQLTVIGATLVAIGVILFAGNFLNFLSMEKLWPLFMMIPVPIFVWLLMQNFKGNSGVLVPLGILTFLAAYFIWLNFTGWELVAVTWPNFILAPAVGLFLLYLVNRHKGLLIPVFVLTATALIFYGALMRSTIAIAVCFILGGVAIIAGTVNRSRKKVK